jgi:predicted methyltransferase/DNA-directed RNA polymerase subunit RPC12/RpoP
VTFAELDWRSCTRRSERTIDNPTVTLADLVAEVADAVRLQEGGAGVQRVLQAFRRLQLTSTKAVSRHAGLPLPLVAAVSNELRARGVLSRDRPSRLTEYGERLLADLPRDAGMDPTCTCCAGQGIQIPDELAPVVARLDDIMSAAPAVDMTLDQSHCTAETKVRRVLLMIRYGILPGPNLLLVGDDDLIGIAVALVSGALGRPLVQHLGIVDISTDVLDFSQDHLSDLGQRVDLVQQDLRQTLDERLTGRYEVAMTDPPYTVEGARLFLSRAVEGLRTGAGRSIIFSFGRKGPDEALAVQQAIGELGLTVEAMHRDFNEYRGAGVIGSRSDLRYLGSTDQSRAAITGDYRGLLYTADKRAADREFRCLDCGAQYIVGPGGQWPYIAALKEAGCPRCGGSRFRPLQLVRPEDRGPARSGRRPRRP